MAVTPINISGTQSTQTLGNPAKISLLKAVLAKPYSIGHIKRYNYLRRAGVEVGAAIQQRAAICTNAPGSRTAFRIQRATPSNPNADLAIRENSRARDEVIIRNQVRDRLRTLGERPGPNESLPGLTEVKLRTHKGPSGRVLGYQTDSQGHLIRNRRGQPVPIVGQSMSTRRALQYRRAIETGSIKASGGTMTRHELASTSAERIRLNELQQRRTDIERRATFGRINEATKRKLLKQVDQQSEKAFSAFKSKLISRDVVRARQADITAKMKIPVRSTTIQRAEARRHERSARVPAPYLPSGARAASRYNVRTGDIEFFNRRTGKIVAKPTLKTIKAPRVGELITVSTTRAKVGAAPVSKQVIAPFVPLKEVTKKRAVSISKHRSLLAQQLTPQERRDIVRESILIKRIETANIEAKDLEKAVKAINRANKTEQFDKADKLLQKYGKRLTSFESEARYLGLVEPTLKGLQEKNLRVRQEVGPPGDFLPLFAEGKDPKTGKKRVYSRLGIRAGEIGTAAVGAGVFGAVGGGVTGGGAGAIPGTGIGLLFGGLSEIFRPAFVRGIPRGSRLESPRFPVINAAELRRLTGLVAPKRLKESKRMIVQDVGILPTGGIARGVKAGVGALSESAAGLIGITDKSPILAGPKAFFDIQTPQRGTAKISLGRQEQAIIASSALGGGLILGAAAMAPRIAASMSRIKNVRVSALKVRSRLARSRGKLFTDTVGEVKVTARATGDVAILGRKIGKVNREIQKSYAIEAQTPTSARVGTTLHQRLMQNIARGYKERIFRVKSDSLIKPIPPSDLAPVTKGFIGNRPFVGVSRFSKVRIIKGRPDALAFTRGVVAVDIAKNVPLSRALAQARARLKVGDRLRPITQNLAYHKRMAGLRVGAIARLEPFVNARTFVNVQKLHARQSIRGAKDLFTPPKPKLPKKATMVYDSTPISLKPFKTVIPGEVGIESTINKMGAKVNRYYVKKAQVIDKAFIDRAALNNLATSIRLTLGEATARLPAGVRFVRHRSPWQEVAKIHKEFISVRAKSRGMIKTVDIGAGAKLDVFRGRTGGKAGSTHKGFISNVLDVSREKAPYDPNFLAQITGQSSDKMLGQALRAKRKIHPFGLEIDKALDLTTKVKRIKKGKPGPLPYDSRLQEPGFMTGQRDLGKSMQGKRGRAILEMEQPGTMLADDARIFDQLGQGSFMQDVPRELKAGYSRKGMLKLPAKVSLGFKSPVLAMDVFGGRQFKQISKNVSKVLQLPRAVPRVRQDSRVRADEVPIVVPDFVNLTVPVQSSLTIPTVKPVIASLEKLRLPVVPKPFELVIPKEPRPLKMLPPRPPPGMLLPAFPGPGFGFALPKYDFPDFGAPGKIPVIKVKSDYLAKTLYGHHDILFAPETKEGRRIARQFLKAQKQGAFFNFMRTMEQDIQLKKIGKKAKRLNIRNAILGLGDF